MPTIRERIADDLLALVNAGSPPVVTQRSRVFAVDLSASKSCILYLVKEDPPEPVRTSEIVLRRARFVFELRAKGTDSSKADEEVDSLASWLVKTVCGQSKGVGNGQLYHMTYEGTTEFDLDGSDHAYSVAKVEVVAQYQTKRNDPDTWA